MRLEVAPSAEGAIRPAQLIVPVTTTTTGYIALDWLQPGAILVNVSLDDPLPEVALRADRLFVDDWPLVRADSRRLLGRMYRAGQIEGPDAPAEPRASPSGQGPGGAAPRERPLSLPPMVGEPLRVRRHARLTASWARCWPGCARVACGSGT